MLSLDRRNYRRIHRSFIPLLASTLSLALVLTTGIWLVNRFLLTDHEQPLMYAAASSIPDAAVLVTPVVVTTMPARTTQALSHVATTPKPSATPAPTPHTNIEEGLWEYSDAGVSVRVEQMETQAKNGTVISYVADVQVQDMSSMRALFAKDTAGRNYTEQTDAMAKRAQAVLAINGDYYGYRDSGIIVRNGVLYRNKPTRECMALYADGSMKVFKEKEMDVEEELAKGLLHTYSFGPGLVIDGEIPDKYVSDVKKPNPRTAVGMIEPGHFIFLVADGRSNGYSNGLSMEELGQMMLDLGCVQAYNLDGGATSEMCFQGETINRPSDGGRKTSDILYIAPAQ